jgi:hypothetical protein
VPSMSKSAAIIFLPTLPPTAAESDPLLSYPPNSDARTSLPCARMVHSSDAFVNRPLRSEHLTLMNGRREALPIKASIFAVLYLFSQFIPRYPKI